MSPAIRHVLAFFLQFGWLGLFLLGVADDSFFFLPVGTDLLMVILVARHPGQFPIFVAAAATGSAAGVFLLDLVCRKGGEEGLKKIVKPGLLDFLKNRIEKHGVAALTVACLAPPPFPFGACVAAASAFQLPKPKLLTSVLVARAVRYALVGWAALHFGRRIIRMAESTEFQWIMGCFIAVCVVGSAISAARWIRIGRTS
jgi:membrane protein YqaA with SNARE-associated domain